MNFNKHWKYLKYVVRHKYYVFQECRKLGVSFRQALLHDISKFRHDEWEAYAEFFYGDHRNRKRKNNEVDFTDDYKTNFDYAWNYHLKRNPHHWQYWILHFDSGDMDVLEMPDRYRKEMLADWRGAGKAQGRNDIQAWYLQHGVEMKLHENTRKWIEEQLGVSIANVEVG